MKNTLRNIGKAVAQIMKKLTAMLKASAAMLAGGGKGGSALAAPDAIEEADVPEFDGPEAQEAFALERKKQGHEIDDIKEFCRGRTYDERAEIGKKLTTKTREWCEGLSPSDRSLVATSHRKALEGHLTQIMPIRGLTPFPKMFGPQSVISPVRPDVGKQLVNDLKRDRAAEGKPKSDIDLMVYTADIDAKFPAPKPASGRPIPQPSAQKTAKRQSPAYAYDPPRPPASITGQRFAGA